MNTPQPGSFPLIRARRRDWEAGISLLVAARRGPQISLGKLLWEPAPEPGRPIEPTLHIDDHDAQSLMDQLWDCGLRPSEGSGSAGALAATQRHLDDFRRLIFDDARFKP
jgi:hypothetical protein